ELAAAGSGLSPLRNRMAALQFEPALPATPSPPLHADDAFPLQKPVQADRTAVIISTRGRPDIVNALVKQLGEQTRPPDHIFVIASAPEDIIGVNKKEDNLTVCVGRTGSSLQRNDGLALAGSRFSYIVFFDDDFVPSRFWIERMLDVFQT